MLTKIRHCFLISLAVLGLALTASNNSHAEAINYFYDDLNRLTESKRGQAATFNKTLNDREG